MWGNHLKNSLEKPQPACSSRVKTGQNNHVGHNSDILIKISSNKGTPAGLEMPWANKGCPLTTHPLKTYHPSGKVVLFT